MQAIGAAGLLLRRVRADAAILLLLFALVAATSFLFAAAPRVFNRVTDEAVRYAVGTASAGERELRLTATGSIGPGTGGGVTAVQAYGELRRQDIPASIDDLVAGRYLGLNSVRFAVRNSIVALTLRHQDGVPDAAQLVAGRWPVDRGTPLRLIQPGQGPGPIVSPQMVRFLAGPADPPVVLEVAISAAAAREAGLEVGDRLSVALDRSDPAVRTMPLNLAPTEIEIVGIFEALDADAAVWAGNGLLEPAFQLGPGGVEAIRTTAYISAESYPNLATSGLPLRYDWHYQFDPADLDGDKLPSLQTDLQRLSLLSSSRDDSFMSDLGSAVSLSDVSFGGGLLGILDSFAAQRDRSVSVLSIAALGPLCLAAAAIAMVCFLLLRRRRSSLLLARGRGASGTLLLGVELLEAVLLCGSAALLGYALAVHLVPARDAPLSPILALAVAGAATLLLLAATWPSARRPLLQLERDDPPVLRVPARRLVIEATVVGIAVLAVVLLRQRGLTLGQSGGSDPLLAAVPLLVGLAAGIVLMRLYPLPVRGLGWAAARRRDFVPVVGLRTVARRPAIANLTLLVLMLTAAFGAFASVINSSIDRGQVAASYVDVGADYRLEDIGIGGLPASLNPSAVPGVEAVASGRVDPRAVFTSAVGQRSTFDLDAIDVGAYAAVTANTAADPMWPRAFPAFPSGADIGTEANPVPAIVSPEFPPGRDELRTGDTFTVEVAGQPITLRLIGRRQILPGLANAGNFAIVPLEWLKAIRPEENLAPTVMWLRSSGDVAAPLAEHVRTASREIRIVSRQDAYGLVHDAPLGTAVADGFGVALSVAVLYLAITLIGAVIMSAAGHTRDLAYLRTLGVSKRQALALTAMEHVPPVLLALIPGVLLGVALALLVEPGLGLSDFTGALAIPLSIDWLTLGLVIAALSAVVVVAIGLGSWLATRSRLISALRMDDS